MALIKFITYLVCLLRMILSISPDKFPIGFSCSKLSFYDGKHIVFSGDSLMHYQYLNFVYSLRHCTEVSAHLRPAIDEHNWESWSQMFHGTNSLLAPFETCDCFRDDSGYVLGQIFTNRYYHDPYRNVTVTYMNLGWNGPLCQGRYRYKTVLTNSTEGFWTYTLPDAIRSHFPLLRSKPDVLLLNAGFFRNSFHIKSYVEEVLNAVNTIPGLRFIWKTTNYGIPDKNHLSLAKRGGDFAERNFFEVDSTMCAIAGVGCLNMSWTKHLPEEEYRYDDYHFSSRAYGWVNRQLLHYLHGESIDLYEKYRNDTKSTVKKRSRPKNFLGTAFKSVKF